MLRWDAVTKLAARLNGVPVLGCRPGSPAACAGVQYGDVLLSVNGVPTPDWGAYVEARALVQGAMRLEVFRDGATVALAFELPPPTATDPAELLEELMERRVLPLGAAGP
ncbi:MAG: PDZ domain-containing protein, partial [Myxococcales bacterium]|nr:PDZ domain-containing protein [Myxococcales bacterium]